MEQDTMVALEAVFKAMARRAPDALRRLRDEGDAAEWARAHHLNADCVVEFANSLKSYWKTRPKQARELRCGIGYGGTIVVCSEERQRRTDDILQELGSHIHGSLRSWRRHADDAHRRVRGLVAAERARRPLRPRREVRRETIAVYAEWFVLYQVLRMQVSEIAGLELATDDSTISKGIAEIRRRTAVPRRT